MTDPDQTDQVVTSATVVLRPKNEHTILADGEQLDSDRHAARYGASDEDVAAVRDLAQANGVEAGSLDKAYRQITLRGPKDVLSSLGPALDNLDGVVTVLGLGDPPRVAEPLFRAADPSTATPRSLTALQVAQAYDFPAGDGAGQTIGIIELGGGFGSSDLSAYFTGLGLKVPMVTAIGVGGAKNVPGQDPNGADGEVLLDIEVVGAVAPGAHINVYFGKNTDQGFLAAITQAVKDGCEVVSISWGGPESSWSAATLDAFDQAFASAATLGTSVFAASGDSGSKDGTGTNVTDFPASSPHVIGCGGTRLDVNADGSIASETVWDDSPTSSAGGGGYSKHFARPSYQPASIGAQRGVPDVSGNADPDSGYQVIVDGQSGVIGGTSAVAPLMAGLAARLNVLGAKDTGLWNLGIYGLSGVFHDVTVGNNGGYKAAAGWDPASGLGSPDGTKLAAALAGTTPVPPTGGGGGTTPPTTGGGGAGSDSFLDYMSAHAPALAEHLDAGAQREHLATGEQFAVHRLAKLYDVPFTA